MSDLSLDAAPDAPLFGNAEWHLLADGLEHRTTGYFIARAMIAGRRSDGLWSWPLQLAEKTWCTPRLFREAVLAAVERFGFERDEALARSFAIGFGLRPASGRREGFVALGDLIRPKPVSRRPAPVEARSVMRNRGESGTSVGRRRPVGANA